MPSPYRALRQPSTRNHNDFTNSNVPVPLHPQRKPQTRLPVLRLDPSTIVPRHPLLRVVACNKLPRIQNPVPTKDLDYCIDPCIQDPKPRYPLRPRVGAADKATSDSETAAFIPVFRHQIVYDPGRVAVCEDVLSC
jgi:hypothetical protein